MTQASDRKIMMLQKMVRRLKRQNNIAKINVMEHEDRIRRQEDRISRLIQRIRGDGAKAPVPDSLQECYNYAVEYATQHKFMDGRELSVFKQVADNSHLGPYQELRGHPVVDWQVHRLDEGLYDLTYLREWIY